MASASDDFNRADSADLGANWDPVVGSSQILTNRAHTNAGTSREVYNAFLPTNDQECQITIGVIQGATTVGGGPLVRMANAPTDTVYQVTARRNTPDTTLLHKIVAGVATQLAAEAATTWAVNDTVLLRAVGTALTVLRNGVSLLTATDGDIASGRGGLVCFGGTSADFGADDWSVTDVGGASSGNYVTTISSGRLNPTLPPGASRE